MLWSSSRRRRHGPFSKVQIRSDGNARVLNCLAMLSVGYGTNDPQQPLSYTKSRQKERPQLRSIAARFDVGL